MGVRLARGFYKEIAMRAAVGFLALLVVPAVARAQGSSAATPLAVDLKKAAIGSWAEYTLTAGSRTGKLRWSLVGRQGDSHVLEMGMEGGMPGAAPPKMTVQMSLVPNPTTATKPVKKLVMQMGEMDPMEMPLDMPNMPEQKFQKPDPKKLVGKEQVKVGAGSFSAGHYRDTVNEGTVDVWINDTIPPLGLVKMTLTPKAGATGPGGRPAMPMALELVGKGTGAKPVITKEPKPFNPAMFGMPGSGPGAPAPAAPAPGKPADKAPATSK
jgi:hypothetical protein